MSYFKTIWGDYFFSFLILFIGLAGAFAASWSYQQYWQDRIESEFREAARDRIEVIRSELEHSQAVLNSLGAFFKSSHEVTHEEFSTFSSTLLADTPFISGLSWIPVVTQADRKKFEAGAKSWKPDFQIMEKDAEGKLVPAQIRPTYAPIYFSEPMYKTSFAGFDYMTDHVRGDALDQARVTRRTIATEKVHLLRTGEDAVLFIQPMFRYSGESEKIRGYLLSAIPLAKLVNAALQPLKPEGVNILIHDHSMLDENNQLMYVRSTRLKNISDEQIVADYKAADRLTETSLLNIGGRQWQITVQSANGYFKMGVPKMSYGILAAGITLSLLLFMFMFSRVQENSRIGRKVTERTRELQQAKSKIETILFSTKDGIIGLDRLGKITFCNPTAASMLGYMKRDLLGGDYHALIMHSRANGDEYPFTETAVAKVLTHAEPVTISDEVMWKRDKSALEAEYNVSPILDNNNVEGMVVTFRDISERREMEKKLEKMARYDQLTGLANRAMMMDQLKKAIARAKRTNKKVGVVYIDLNNFKPINDTLGHAAGDMILKTFAERLNKSSREYDMPARLGGDEFTVLVDNLDEKEGCYRLIERLRENLKEPVTVEGKEISMSGSMGVAFYPDDSQDHDELISHADSAMYIAKKDKSLPYAVYKGK